MKKINFVRLASFVIICVLTTFSPLHAQKLSRKALRALKAQETLELQQLSDIAAQAYSTNASFRTLQKASLEQIRISQQMSKNHLGPISKKAWKSFFIENASKDNEQAIQDAVRLINPGKYHKKKRPSNWLPFNPYTKIAQILDGYKSPIKAFEIVTQLEDLYPENSFFFFFASVYYNQYLSILTPHLKELFKKIENLQDRQLQFAFIKRMRFLLENRDRFRRSFAPHVPRPGMRLRYMKDIGKLTPANFNPNHLIFSFEQKMNPEQDHIAFIKNINTQSVFPVGKQLFPVYQYSGSFDYLSMLYRYLLNGKNTKQNLTVLFDKDAKAMAIYNADRTRWLRITPHEYASAENLHIHLNEIRTADIVTNLGQIKQETVNFNLSIPLSTPSYLPTYSRNEFLYNEMILKPLQHLKGSDHVKIIEQPIF